MLEYVCIIKGNHYKLGFIDEKSPKDWEPIINHKLSKYKENAYTDSTYKTDNVLVILELEHQNEWLNDSQYITRKRKDFEDYYKHILEDVGNSELY